MIDTGQIIKIQQEQIRRHQKQIERMIAAARRVQRTLLVTTNFNMASVDASLSYLLAPEWPPSKKEQELMCKDLAVLLEDFYGITTKSLEPCCTICHVPYIDCVCDPLTCDPPEGDR